MLIPSIDLLGGRVVQLEQGDRLVVESRDISGWVQSFSAFPVVQVIDLDAAKGTGENTALVRQICVVRPCQVGGGLRTPAAAAAAIAAGAMRVIVGSALFDANGVNQERAAAFAAETGRDRLLAAIDTREGRVAVTGWSRTVALDPFQAMRALEPFVGGFLYTHIDTEGLMTGFDLTLASRLRDATTRRLIVAGGIRSMAEVTALDELQIDAVVGMAIYKENGPLRSIITAPAAGNTTRATGTDR